MTNKTTEVLKYLQKNKSITSMEAIDKFGATRLSDIIFRLRGKGHNIVTNKEEQIDRYGNTCYFGRYVYLGKEKTLDELWNGLISGGNV